MKQKESSSSKHVSIWGAWYGSRNVGDQALLLTIADILTCELGDVRFTVFTDDPAHVNSYARSESDCTINAIHSRRQLYRVAHTLAACDLLIFGGGVPFYAEREHLAAMGLLVGMARAFHTPYMTWTVSSQVVGDRLAKRLFKWVLDGASAITYRDEHTRQLFESCGVDRPMYLAGDSGFWLRAANDEAAQEVIRRSGMRYEERPLVALTPRTLRGRDGDAQKHYNIKTPEQYQQEVSCFVAALDWLWEHGYQPILAPMNTAAPDDDRIAARCIIEQSRHGSHAMLIDEEIRPRMAPAIYRQCRASFVARVHGSITSMVAQCPVMMYAFAPKHAGIMKAMDLADYSLLEETTTPAKTVGRLADLLANCDQIRGRMAERLVALRQEALIPSRLAAQILHK